jgi:hypothetical protein
MNPTQIFGIRKELNKSEINKINRVHWAEFALGPDAQCGARPTWAHGPRPHGAACAHTAHARGGSVQRRAARRAGGVAAPVHGRRWGGGSPVCRLRRVGDGRRRRATRPAAVRATRLGQRRLGRRLSGRGGRGTDGCDEARGRDVSCRNAA